MTVANKIVDPTDEVKPFDMEVNFELIPGFAKMGLEDLESIQKFIDGRIKEIKMEKIREGQEKVKLLAEQLGVSYQELIGTRISKPKDYKSPVSIPKYVNPENQSETWGGRGNRPEWLRRALDEGAQLEDFLID